MRQHLTRGDVVCFDATSVTRRRRRTLVSLAREASRPVVAICMSVSPDIAWKRNAARGKAKVPWPAFQQLRRALQPPKEDEGFAAVVIVEAGGE